MWDQNPKKSQVQRSHSFGATSEMNQEVLWWTLALARNHLRLISRVIPIPIISIRINTYYIYSIYIIIYIICIHRIPNNSHHFPWFRNTPWISPRGARGQQARGPGRSTTGRSRVRLPSRDGLTGWPAVTPKMGVLQGWFKGIYT